MSSGNDVSERIDAGNRRDMTGDTEHDVVADSEREATECERDTVADVSSDAVTGVDSDAVADVDSDAVADVDLDAVVGVDPDAVDDVERAVWNALRTVEDPELPVSIVDLGLIYEVSVRDGHAAIDLTVTYSGCPGREMIVGDAADAARTVDGVDDVGVTVVYSPPWSVDRITDRGRERLGEFGLAVPGDQDQQDPDCHE